MKKDNLIFIHKLLKAIGDSIIKVFIPLYILKQSYDINLAMSYLVMYSSFVLGFMFILKKVIQKYGVICIFLHFIPIILTGAILSFKPITIMYIGLCACLMALSQALYSIPINLIFTFGDKKTNVGKFQIPTNIGKLIFTLISGYILASSLKNSFLILNVAASIFYIASIIPLFFAYHELIENYHIYENCETENLKPDPMFIIFHICFGLFQPIMDNIVPLFLYVNHLSFKAVTLMIVLVELLKIFMNYSAQKLVKRGKAKICVCLSFALFIVSSIGMIFVRVPVILYILSTTCSISFPLTFVPMFRLYCNHLKEANNVFDGITKRDFEIFAFRPALYGLSFLGFGLYPCLILGVCIVPVMLYTELKLLKEI